MNIFRLPSPVLREQSEEIKNIDARTVKFGSELMNFMFDNKGCVGIAAPQVGRHIRLITIDSSRNKKTTQSAGRIIMINPRIIEHSGKTINREGCLSVPDFTGNIERAENIKVYYVDINGEERKLETSGFEAVIIQHELDHLNGVLFVDRIKSIKHDLFQRKNY